MDSNHDSAANRPTQQFRPAGTPGPGRPGPGPAAPGAGGRPPRGGRAIRWTAGLAAAAVLVGGGAALAASSGSSGASAAGLTGTGQAAVLNDVLTSAASPTSAEAAAASPTSSPAAPAAGTAHPCARAATALRAAGHPKAASRAGAACRGRLGRLRLLIAGEHGQVTYKAKDGTSKTLAFERGKVTAVSGTAITVQAGDGTTGIWHLVSDSVVREGGQKVAATTVAVGQQVFAGGPVVSGADDARLIVIRPAAPAASSSAPSGS
jgi:hypothetical protein